MDEGPYMEQNFHIKQLTIHSISAHQSFLLNTTCSGVVMHLNSVWVFLKDAGKEDTSKLYKQTHDTCRLIFIGKHSTKYEKNVFLTVT